MSRTEKQLFDRLGPTGLTRVLDDLLDRNRLVRLANACGLEYPGSRTRSQSRERILTDLAQKAGDEAAAWRTIHRSLVKETRAAAREWARQSDEEKARRLGDQAFLLSKGRLGLHLFLLANAESESQDSGFESLLARQHLLRLAADGSGAKPKSVKPTRQETRLKKRAGELEKKIQHLEAQLAKSRETEKTSKRSLIQRKGELAESRMLVERLRGELDQAQAAVRKATTTPTPPVSEVVSELNKTIRRLTSQQKKLTYQLEKLPDPKATPDGKALAPLTGALEALQREFAALKRDRKKEGQEQLKRLEELRAEIAASRVPLEPPKPVKAPRTRPRRGTERIGVFIDVQNMYYGARQLKGKLDFDALMQAAVQDRRLIQATAYVVESKEIDQSGFIALLEQRGIEVRRKTLQVRADGSMKGDWDMELALDILEAVAGLDVVVLVSGDGDFTSLIKRVRRQGPRVEVIGFPRNTAKSLIGAADRFVPLDRKFMIYPRIAKKRQVKTRAKPRSPAKTPTARAAAPEKVAGDKTVN
jgi:uncharacterized LabA/DUF88 family protein